MRNALKKYRKKLSLCLLRPVIFLACGLGYLPLHSADVNPDEFRREPQSVERPQVAPQKVSDQKNQKS